jgi:hypothetical protein
VAIAPVLVASIILSSGASFGAPLVLDSEATPLGVGVLGTTDPYQIVDVSNQVMKASINRAYNRLSDSFQGGRATVVLQDQTGQWNPANVSSIYYPNVLPMRKIQLAATYAGTKYFLGSFYIQAWRYTAPQEGQVGYVTLDCVDGFQLLNLSTVSTIAGSPAGQLSGARINAILDAASFPSSQRTIDVGQSTMQADPGTANRSALSAIQLIEQSELGAFYFDQYGNARFVDRQSSVQAQGATPTKFADDGSGITYQQVTYDFSDTGLINSAAITINGGTAQTASNATSIANYFQHNRTRTGLMMETDAEALSMAQSIVASRSDTTIRVESVTINTGDGSVPARVVAGLELDYFDPITVQQTQAGGSSISTTLVIQGVSYDIAPNKFMTTFIVADPYATGFVLDSATMGVLGTSYLGY